jgi:hypothetical protein
METSVFTNAFIGYFIKIKMPSKSEGIFNTFYQNFSATKRMNLGTLNLL